MKLSTNKPCHACKHYKNTGQHWCLEKRTFTSVARITNNGLDIPVKLIECWSV